MAPLLLLAAIGVRGLQMSQQAAREAAEAQAKPMLVAARPAMDGMLERLRAAHVEVRLYPAVPVPPGERWVASTDMMRGGSAMERWRRLVAMPPDEARAGLLSLARDKPDELTESGLPLLPLIQWQLLHSETGAAALDKRAQSVARAALVTHPSILAPEFLQRIPEHLAGRGANADGWQSEWKWRWQELEKKRALLLEHPAVSGNRRAAAWIDESGGSWLVLPATSGAWWVFPQKEVRDGSQRLIEQVNAGLPEYARARFVAGGRHFPPGAEGEVLATLPHEGFELQVVLADPGRLYAALDAQTTWLAALLVCALAAELAAFWAMRRALTREARLGELKSAFVSSVSHELRAPVASMRLMAENLEAGVVAEPEQRQAYHRLMAEECRRLSVLIDNVLDFARIEQDRRLYHMTETDLAALVREAVELTQPRAAQRRQQIHAEPEPLERICDGLAVRQALINLLDNAIKFSPEGGAIHVQLAARPGEWTLAVADAGPGIPPEEHLRIFERFYRLGDELRRETQGTGIGLSIVEHIAQAHGGRVKVESAPGAGARFTLVIPEAIADAG